MPGAVVLIRAVRTSIFQNSTYAAYVATMSQGCDRAGNPIISYKLQLDFVYDPRNRNLTNIPWAVAFPMLKWSLSSRKLALLLHNSHKVTYKHRSTGEGQRPRRLVNQNGNKTLTKF